MNRNCCTWLLIGLIVVAGCAGNEPEERPDPGTSIVDSQTTTVLSIFTVNYPLQYFAQRIGGDRVEVTFPAPAGEDPAYWSPGPETVADYQRADLILLNGVGYAKWLERATMPAGKLVDTSAGFEDRWIPLDEGPVHTHGPEGEHSHKGYAFTTWLDPELAIEQARSVAAALVEAEPEHREEFEAALESLVVDLQDLDAILESAALEIGDAALLFSHPVYQYLVARYGLSSRSVHWEPGESPDEELWQELESILTNHPAHWMIWEGEPAGTTVERLQELGLKSVVYDPSANTPEAGDLLSVMRSNAEALQTIAAAK